MTAACQDMTLFILHVHLLHVRVLLDEGLLPTARRGGSRRAS